MFPEVSHPQALLGSLVSISWKFQFTKIVSEFFYKFLKKHSIKDDLNCLDPGNMHLNNLNAPVLNVLKMINIVKFTVLGFRNKQNSLGQPSAN